jgi:outer membrane protein assembly factor BamB
LNLATGDLQWTHDFLEDAPPDPEGFDGSRARFGDILARPQNCSSDGKTAYFNVFDQCRVVGVDVETGERRVSLQTEGWISSRPAVTESRVLLGSQDRHVYAMDQDMGHAVWRFQTGSRVSAASAIANNRVFVGSCDAHFYCLDLATGDEIWRFEIDHGEGLRGSIYEQAIVSEANVILPAMNGYLYACDLETGELHWKMRVDEHSEIVDCQTDGEMLFLSTRRDSEDRGRPALFAVGHR